MTETSEGGGLLFVLVGPGGVGKNTLMNRVLKRVENLHQLPTATTRQPRNGETQGREHVFVSLAEFEGMQQRGELLEQQEVTAGKWYGVPRATVEDAIRERCHQIADIEYLGARILRRAYPQSVILIFIAPPSMDVLEQRMRERGTKDHVIRERIERAQIEMTFAPECDYLIVNEALETATEQLYDLISARLAGGDIRAYSTHDQGINFDVSVIPVAGGDAMVREDGAVLRTRIKGGETVSKAVSALVTSAGARLPEADQGNLVFAAEAGRYPVQVIYDGTAGKYRLHFVFACEVEDTQTAPPGYVWKSRQDVVIPKIDNEAVEQ